MTTIDSQKAFVSDLLQYIIARCSGSHDLDTEINVRPSNRFFIGSLAPKKPQIEDIDEVKIEKENIIRAQMHKIVFPVETSSLSKKSSIKINGNGYVYYLRSPSSTNEEVIDKPKSSDNELIGRNWKRESFSFEFTLEYPLKGKYCIPFDTVVEKINSDPLCEKKIPLDLWNASIEVYQSSYDDTSSLISIEALNNSIDPIPQQPYERTLFNFVMNVSLENIHVLEFSDEYEYEGNNQKYFYSFRPINCQVEWREPGISFKTTHYGLFEQPNIRPKNSLENSILSFNKLRSKTESITELHKLLIAFRKLETDFDEELNTLPQKGFLIREGKRQRSVSEKRDQIIQFKQVLKELSNGINLLENNQDVLSAFNLMNETFYQTYLQQNNPNGEWRLFQIVFIISLLSSIVKRENLDTVHVLHVDTGGGKSEAYFAVITFALFYNRMKGYNRGVHSIVKFPLRMLSIQQLERLATIVVNADDIRKNNLLPQGEPFSLGYYIGNSEEFPSKYAEIRSQLYHRGKVIEPAPSSLILPKCPFCREKEEGIVSLHDDEIHKRIVHRCNSCNREFFIYYSDREIFRWRPSVIVSTVDKWAGLSSQRRARNLLGGSGSQCPYKHGFIPSGDYCEDNKEEAYSCKKIGGDEEGHDGPILSIQDEMHLLKEGFGTISSHFESLIEYIVNKTSNHKIKHIAMSATLNGTKTQIHELYNKNTIIIPGTSPEGIGSSKDFFFEKLNGPKRIICGLKPNMQDNHTATLRTLLYYAEFIIEAQLTLLKNPDEFTKKYGCKTPQEAQDIITQFIVPVTYHLKKQDVQDMSRFRDYIINGELSQRYPGSVIGKVLTGDSKLEELKVAMNEVRDYIKNYNPEKVLSETLTIDPLYATSVISHGVDLEELNFMVFQGIPYSTSEYIQALSRVGRKKLGLIIVWFYPTRVRDDSFYRNFYRYHDTLDHQVKPVPITRSARLGYYQTLNSIFCALIINHISNIRGEPLYRKKHIKSLKEVEIKEIINGIQEIYGGQNEIDIEREVKERISFIVEDTVFSDNTFFPNILSHNSGDSYYRNQTGMRGIQKQLILQLKPDDEQYINQIQ
ncbi:helicase-like protein [Methanospirillum hungatei JF-1]|uniref:Helicase-like protein n=1 Tax=Methanospirillum hungatei JF-1 (strain ATCC 27890 / DSM 864 / NBRC 100397 / JF-1) TaxID=323259 RepID=Q2FP02_METHJ|nr:helicase C-terminal domain-containing protein [Methanospirillum hungatei]ABD41247.1 helicase-like protein [Methanospirillum hungatei JF-1]